MTPRDARAALPKGLEDVIKAYAWAVVDAARSNAPTLDGTLLVDLDRLADVRAAILSYGASERGGGERDEIALRFCLAMFQGDVTKDGRPGNFDVAWCYGAADAFLEEREKHRAPPVVALAAGPGGEGGGSDAE